MQKFNSQYQLIVDSSSKETVNKKSVTLPGKAFSLRELISNHLTGIGQNVAKVPQYATDPTFDDFDPSNLPDFDYSDVTRLLSEAEVRISAYQAEKKRRDDEAAAAAAAAEEKRRADEAAAAAANAQTNPAQ